MSTSGISRNDAVHVKLEPDWQHESTSVDGGVTAPGSDVNAVMANAAEELTFMFSEKVEQATRKLEGQVEEHVRVEKEGLPIERVQAVVRMLEGSKAYAQVRTMARQFLLAYERGEAEPERFLQLQSMRPEARYIALRQVLDVLTTSGGEVPPTLSMEHQVLMNEHGEQLSRIFESSVRSPAGAAGASLRLGRPATLSEESLLSVLALKPTARSVFDAALGLDEPSRLQRSLRAFQLGSAQLLRHAENVSLLVIVNNLIGIVRSMLYFAAEFERGSTDEHHSAKLRRDRHLRVRLLLDIAHSSIPSGLVEKVIASLYQRPLGSSAPERIVFLCALHRQIGLWPDSVFPGPDSRTVIKDQVLRMQPMTRPGMAMR